MCLGPLAYRLASSNEADLHDTLVNVYMDVLVARPWHILRGRPWRADLDNR